jgi:hypothetical protein
MVKEKDIEVAKIWHSWDYDKFKILPENRGLKFSDGINPKKVAQLQKLIDDGLFVEEESLVKVNEDFFITQGAHNFQVRKNNKMPIRYTIVTDHRFNNGTSRRDMISNVLGINTVDTSWKRSQVFNAAFHTKCPLAVLIHELIIKHNERFGWQEIMGLLTKEENFFSGYHKINSLKPFTDKSLIETFNSPGFKAELNYFFELNAVFRASYRKGLLMKAAYLIINKCKEMMDIRKFMKVILTIPDHHLNSHTLKNMTECICLLLNYYNKAVANKVVTKTVMYQIGVTSRKNKAAKKVLLKEAA